MPVDCLTDWRECSPEMFRMDFHKKQQSPDCGHFEFVQPCQKRFYNRMFGKVGKSNAENYLRAITPQNLFVNYCL